MLAFEVEMNDIAHGHLVLSLSADFVDVWDGYFSIFFEDAIDFVVEEIGLYQLSVSLLVHAYWAWLSHTGSAVIC